MLTPTIKIHFDIIALVVFVSVKFRYYNENKNCNIHGAKMKKCLIYLLSFLSILIPINTKCYGQYGQSEIPEVAMVFMLFSVQMNSRGYPMTIDDCKFYQDNVIGDYAECKITNDVYVNIFYDRDDNFTGMKVTGFQKKAGKLNPDTDTAFRVAYACFFNDTRETTYQNWLKNIQLGMEKGMMYTINGIGAIWGEGLITGKTDRNGQYNYNILFSPK